MHRFRTAVTVVLAILLFLMCEEPSLADMIVFPRTGTDFALLGGIVIVIPLLLTVIIEYEVLYVVLMLPSRLWWRVLAAVSLVNLITLPPALLAWWHVIAPGRAPFSHSNVVVLTMLLEAVIVLVEFLLLRWLFRRFWRRGFFSKPVNNGRLILAVLLANIASFAFGCILPGAMR